MSVDTRTPRTPTGDRSSGIDDAPALSMVKVPSDPAQVIVNHASFRVQFGASARAGESARIARHWSATQDTARMPVAGAAGPAAPAAARRRALVWSGRSDRTTPAHTGCSRRCGPEPVTTPRTRSPTPEPHRSSPASTSTGGAPSYDGYDDGPPPRPSRPRSSAPSAAPSPTAPAAARHAHRRQRLRRTRLHRRGLRLRRRSRQLRRRRHRARRAAHQAPRRRPGAARLLPRPPHEPRRRAAARCASSSASSPSTPASGKLCDPVYFDGGERGSMVKWLNTLHPWDVAEPLRQFALEHPVGAGLVIAFLQVIVGVLTVLGCWQRVGAVIGAGLSRRCSSPSAGRASPSTTRPTSSTSPPGPR